MTLAELACRYDVIRSTILRLPEKFTMPGMIVERHASPSADVIEFPHTRKLHQNVVKWIDVHLNTPEFHEFKRKQIGYALYDDIIEKLDDFVLAPEIAKEHTVIIAFLGIWRAQSSSPSRIVRRYWDKSDVSHWSNFHAGGFSKQNLAPATPIGVPEIFKRMEPSRPESGA